MDLTRVEQETIILFNEAEPQAEVYTYNQRLKEKLEDLARRFPEEIARKEPDRFGAATFTVPKRLVTVNAPFGEQRRKAARDRALQANLRPPARSRDPQGGGAAKGPG